MRQKCRSSYQFLEWIDGEVLKPHYKETLHIKPWSYMHECNGSTNVVISLIQHNACFRQKPLSESIINESNIFYKLTFYFHH